MSKHYHRTLCTVSSLSSFLTQVLLNLHRKHNTNKAEEMKKHEAVLDELECHAAKSARDIDRKIHAVRNLIHAQEERINKTNEMLERYGKS